MYDDEHADTVKIKAPVQSSDEELNSAVTQWSDLSENPSRLFVKLLLLQGQ